MNEELLGYYNRELSFVRKLFKEFAEKHPTTAAVLRIAEESCDDPHVERMIMAFAYLTARIRYKLEDDFPELTDALLGVLHPHYLAPIPSMAIAQLALDRDQAKLTDGHRLEPGTQLETEAVPISGSRSREPCTYRTSFPVTLWPLEVASARITRRPFAWSRAPTDAVAVLRLELKCWAPEMTFDKLKLPGLRFFLNGQAQHVFALYELIFNNTVEVTVANVLGKDTRPIALGGSSILPVGFAREEGLLPYPAQSFLGYRLLTEYFVLPEKFCFFEIAGLSPEVRHGLGNAVEICLYLNRLSVDLENNVGPGTFQLGCTPIVNLFRQDAEPIAMTHTQSEYPLVVDRRRRQSREVYSIDGVSATSGSGETTEYQPFYSFKHAQSRERRTHFWYGTRRPSSLSEDLVDHGTEVYLSLVDLDLNTAEPVGWTLHPRTTCLNRDLPGRLPFGGGQPKLSLVEGSPMVAKKIACLTPPTPTLRLRQGNPARWRVISHLLLNHLSISEGEEAAQALREILGLYNYADSPVTSSKIAGVLGVKSRRVVGRSSGSALGGICRGLEITVHLDEEAFSDNSLFLFASVLERFLGMYCSINSFTQLRVTTNKRSEPVRLWLPRAGEKILA